MQNKYPYRKKWPTANLKGKPGKRSSGSSIARRKLTQTSALIVHPDPYKAEKPSLGRTPPM